MLALVMAVIAVVAVVMDGEKGVIIMLDIGGTVGLLSAIDGWDHYAVQQLLAGMRMLVGRFSITP